MFIVVGQRRLLIIVLFLLAVAVVVIFSQWRIIDQKNHPPSLNFITPLFTKGNDGEFTCSRETAYQNGFIDAFSLKKYNLDDYGSLSSYKSKFLRIAGSFNADFNSEASLSVNGKEISVHASNDPEIVQKGDDYYIKDVGFAMFDEILDIELNEGKNYLLFKARHPNGDIILRDCYIYYDSSVSVPGPALP